MSALCPEEKPPYQKPEDEEGQDKEPKKKEVKGSEKEAPKDEEKKEERPPAPVTVKIEFEGVRSRVRRLPLRADTLQEPSGNGIPLLFLDVRAQDRAG